MLQGITERAWPASELWMMRASYRGGHDGRPFHIIKWFRTKAEATAEAGRLEQSKPFADEQGGLRGYDKLVISIEQWRHA